MDEHSQEASFVVEDVLDVQRLETSGSTAAVGEVVREGQWRKRKQVAVQIC